MLRPGNVPYLRSTRSELRIATLREDKKWLLAQNAIIKLGDYIDVTILECDHRISLSACKYQVLIDLYRFLHSEGAGDPSESSLYVYWQPDIYLPDGSLQWLCQQANTYKAVMVPGIRVNKKEFLEETKKLNGLSQSSKKDYKSFLHQILVRNLHYMSLSLEIDSSHFYNDWPSHLYAIDRNSYSIVIKGFHYHPMLLVHSPKQFLESSFGTIDDRLIDVLKIERQDILTATSSEQFLQIELSKKSDAYLQFEFFDIRKVAFWAMKQSSAHHRNFESTYIASASATNLNPKLVIYLEEIRRKIYDESIKIDREVKREALIAKIKNIPNSMMSSIIAPFRQSIKHI